MKVERKRIIRTEIVAPKGWGIVGCGVSQKGDMWDSADGTWKPCPCGVGCGNVAIVIRERR